MTCEYLERQTLVRRGHDVGRVDPRFATSRPEFSGNVIQQLRHRWISAVAAREGIDPAQVERALIIGATGRQRCVSIRRSGPSCMSVMTGLSTSTEPPCPIEVRLRRTAEQVARCAAGVDDVLLVVLIRRLRRDVISRATILIRGRLPDAAIRKLMKLIVL